jgi:hypothetical protein
MKFMSNEHQEDTKYKQWSGGMHVMLDDLEGDYELALVENSLRDSVYFDNDYLFVVTQHTNCLGVADGDAGAWGFAAGWRLVPIKLTRAQALYIATGDTDI